MRTISKLVLIGGMVALTVAGVNALAEECSGPGMHGGMRGMDQKKMEQMREAHHKALHDALKLDAKQEDAWKKLLASEGKMPMAHPDMAELEKLNAPQRMEKMLEAMRKHEAEMADHLSALKEFYAVLTPQQQKTFDEHAMPRHHKGMHGEHP